MSFLCFLLCVIFQRQSMSRAVFIFFFYRFDIVECGITFDLELVMYLW